MAGKKREYDLKFDGCRVARLLKRWHRTHSHFTLMEIFAYFFNLIRQMVARFAHIQLHKDYRIMDELCNACSVRVLAEVIPRLDAARPDKLKSYAAKAIYAEIRNFLKEQDMWVGVVSIYNIPDPEAEVVSEDDLDARRVTKQVSQLLSVLTSRERKVVSLQYGFGGKIHSPKEIGKKLHLSAIRIYQIEASVLKQLRSGAKKNGN